jgi:hypothetical protein
MRTNGSLAVTEYTIGARPGLMLTCPRAMLCLSLDSTSPLQVSSQTCTSSQSMYLDCTSTAGMSLFRQSAQEIPKRTAEPIATWAGIGRGWHCGLWSARVTADREQHAHVLLAGRQKKDVSGKHLAGVWSRWIWSLNNGAAQCKWIQGSRVGGAST